MSEINDGGPASLFTPTDRSGQIGPAEGGMSLRDWFAGQALAGVIASAEGLGNATREERQALFGQVAELLYDVADAMLA